jgi:hypothetical protein
LLDSLRILSRFPAPDGEEAQDQEGGEDGGGEDVPDYFDVGDEDKQ